MPKGVYKRTKEGNRRIGLFRKGKTYEEIYGAKKAEEIKEKRRNAVYHYTKKSKEKLTFKNERHPRWKGDDAGVLALHGWIYRHYGKATKCDNPKCFGKGKRFEWSNKKGHKYTRNINDYQQLCSKCHKAFDMEAV